MRTRPMVGSILDAACSFAQPDVASRNKKPRRSQQGERRGRNREEADAMLLGRKGNKAEAWETQHSQDNFYHTCFEYTKHASNV